MLCACGAPSSSGHSGIEGVWYAQEPGGAVLTVAKDTLRYEHYDYTSKTKYSFGETTSEGTQILIRDEFWSLIDILYDSDADTITGHDLPHTDGDGGYHLHVFKRTEYVPTPEPVYGERTDRSDPDVPKEFTESRITGLQLTVTEPFRDSGDMAPEQPDAGDYSYTLAVKEDGTAVLSSDFCRDITVSGEQMEELGRLFFESGLPSLNGLDIFTEGMPGGTQYYDLSIAFEDGQEYHSSANGKDVSVIWYTEGYRFHQYLFDLFCDAGYNAYTGGFHSTGPMKRIGLPEGESAAYAVRTEMIKTELAGQAYDYTADTKYPVFTAEGDAPAALMESLHQISEQYREKAEAALQEDYEMMAAADESVWRNAERRYAYSFYTPSRETVRKGMFTFWLSEGHSCSMGIGKYGYGYYPDMRFAIDEESGRILAVNDLFTDEEALCGAVTDALCRQYPYEEYTGYFTSGEYSQVLKEALSVPESEGGIGFTAGYEGLTLFFTDELSKDRDHPFTLTLYYDSVQEILDDTYCSVR
ncbi:MAG: hypothetical protein K6G61_04460 [Solobacterium sp.]|nr:hypothetical protein [Solobacterium sp.]